MMVLPSIYLLGGLGCNPADHLVLDQIAWVSKVPNGRETCAFWSPNILPRGQMFKLDEAVNRVVNMLLARVLDSVWSQVTRPK